MPAKAGGELQYGAGLRLTADLLYASKNRGLWANWKVAASISVTKQFGAYLPGLHVDFISGQGGIGTRDKAHIYAGRFFQRPLNAFFAITPEFIQFGCPMKEDKSYGFSKGKPLYYLFDFTYPALTNPYSYSFALGTSFIFNVAEFKWQRVSKFNANLQNLQVEYVNDGPPFALKKTFGDEYDRWFTGALIINYFNGNKNLPFDNLSFSYYKFTGSYQRNYEIATDLGIADVPYKDPDQQLYNTGCWSLKAFNSRKGLGTGIIAYDLHNKDLQHYLHFGQYFAHHISANPRKLGVLGFYQPKLP